MTNTALALLLFATLNIHVDRGKETQPLDVAVGLQLDDDSPPKPLAHARIAAGKSDVTIGDLPAGVMSVMISGASPFERVSAKAVVGASDTRRVNVAIRPVVVRGHVTFGGAPLPRAKVSVSPFDGDWGGALQADDAGAFAVTLWERPQLLIAASGGPVAEPYSILTVPRNEVTLAIPDRTLRGRVTDPKGAPVAGARLWLKSRDESVGTIARFVSDANGAFALRGTRAGAQTLRVTAAGYLDAPPREFEIAAEEREHEVHIVLTPGVVRRIEVKDAHGLAVANAQVLCATESAVLAVAKTNALGRAEIATVNDAGAALFIFPADGSLAVRELRDDLKITMPRASAALHINALGDGDAPLANVSMLIRYDGHIIPPAVLEHVRRLAVTTDARGRIDLDRMPPGTYELWPYATPEEAGALLASATAGAAPIVVNATTGENHVTARFRSR